MSEKIDINKDFDELFEEFKTEFKLPERKKEKLDREHLRKLENEYCEAIYGRDFAQWREKRQKERGHSTKHNITCTCGEKYTLYIEPDLSYSRLFSTSQYYLEEPTVKIQYHDIFCMKCGSMIHYTGKLKYISNERGKFNME